MSTGKKKSLGTVVECAEGSEEASRSQENRAEPRTVRMETTLEQPGSSGTHRKRWTGSRLSLTSLFSFSAIGHRERKRSPCGTSSHSSGDLRTQSLSSHSLANRRYQMTELEEGMSEQADASEDPLLSEGDEKKNKLRECPLCYMKQPMSNFPRLIGCGHRSCRLCLMQYVELEIMENRVEVSCPECTAHLHPSDIAQLVGGRGHLIEKYEQFSLRRYLMTEADTRFCPAPDCGFAVIASGCAACPQLRCGRPECETLFCYHCKGVWHANQTCDEARRQRGPSAFRSKRGASNNVDVQLQLKPGDIKACPRCRTYIVKMDDGSCNHMVCAMCSAEFCWLCLKEISDLHYLSPTGCTFWGKKPWTRKKKLLWQLGTLIGAPVGIALIAGLSIPGIIFGVPVFVGRKVHQRFSHQTKLKRRLITAACIAGSLVVSPVLAVMAVGVGVPIMLAYVYGVVPLSLCRNGGCGLTESQSFPTLDNLDEDELWAGGEVGNEKSQLLSDGERVTDDTSLGPALSMQSGISQATHRARLAVKHDGHQRRASVESGENSIGERTNYEEASTKALQGSQYQYDDKSVHTVYSSGQEALSYSEDVASTKALAGSVHDTKSLSGSMGAARHVICRAEMNDRIAEDSQEAKDEKKSVCEDAPCSSSCDRQKAAKRMSSGSRQGVNFVAVNEDVDEIVLMGEENQTNLSLEREKGDSSLSEHDPFHIRTIMDTMKQMTAADLPDDVPTTSRGTRLRSSNSSRSEDVERATTTNTATITKPKRRFFGLLPPKRT